MNVSREQIYLAALLHDIGKFYQRAEEKINENQFKFLKNEFWNKPEIYCPVYKGKYTHKHVLWTAQFIQKHSLIFENLGIEANEGDNSLTRLAALHHNPGNNIYAQIIQLADWYSSGVDRTLEEYSIDDGFEEDWDKFKKRRMTSIFEKIHNDENNEYNYLLPVHELDLSDIFFPKNIEELKNIVPDYNRLWNNFEKDFKLLPTTNFNVFSESLLYLLQKYTVTIPSSTNHLPDVSLYDHSKTTATFAVAIYDFFIENNRLPGKDDDVVNLIGGDISGIQKFIYDIISKNAAKNLKGRSFYLQLMVESIIRYILKELNLFSANIVYASGGGFYILSSNYKNFSKKLEKINKKILNNLFDDHKTNLFIALDYVKIKEITLLPEKHKIDINKNGVGAKWRELIEKLNKKKRQRYSERIVEDFNNFFEPIEQGGESKENRDSITGEELKPEEITTLDDKETIVSKATKQQIQLGKDLKKAKYWIIAQENFEKLLKTKPYNPLNLGYYHYFVEDIPVSIPDNSTILAINETDFTPLHSNAKYAVGFTFYGGNNYPTGDDDSPKTFDKLVGEGDFKRLGILRMDVDNLGQIFINGLSERKRTFSRYSTLSRSLDFFFTGYLNKIQQENENYTYILYAGGDDLFILGKWDLLIKMAKKIRDKFAEWTCHNPKVTISGGIAIVTPKFPILKAADLAGDEENNAKNYENEAYSLKKNAISILGYSLSWQKNFEFDIITSLQERILKLIYEHNLPKSFVGNVSAFYELRQNQIKRGKNQTWQWLMAYQLKRFMEGKSDEIKEFIAEIQKDVFANSVKGEKNTTKYHYLELLNLACRLAELDLRTNKKSE